MKTQFKSIYTNQFKTVLWITFFWTLISIIFLAFEYLVLIENGISPAWAMDGYFWKFFLITTSTFAVIGMVGALFIIFVLLPWFRTHPYGLAIFYSILSFTILFFLLTAFQMFFLVLGNVGWNRVFREVWNSLVQYFSTIDFVRYFFFWLFILIATMISLFVRDKYGPGILKKFLLGKYFHPKEEDRIFMFLDLKGSTTIAELLGEHKYFNFLKKVFIDVTASILETQGEIYQYVGDEIIISWPLKKGLKNAYCIHCFFKIQKALQLKKDYYEHHFGIQPVFKAGLHCGNVIAGEIGVIKRDIAFSGDVLNTTARIQSKCNEMGVFILISGELINLLSADSAINHQPKWIGEVPLRGKENPVELYTLV